MNLQSLKPYFYTLGIYLLLILFLALYFFVRGTFFAGLEFTYQVVSGYFLDAAEYGGFVMMGYYFLGSIPFLSGLVGTIGTLGLTISIVALLSDLLSYTVIVPLIAGFPLINSSQFTINIFLGAIYLALGLALLRGILYLDDYGDASLRSWEIFIMLGLSSFVLVIRKFVDWGRWVIFITSGNAVNSPVPPESLLVTIFIVIVLVIVALRIISKNKTAQP